MFCVVFSRLCGAFEAYVTKSYIKHTHTITHTLKITGTNGGRLSDDEEEGEEDSHDEKSKKNNNTKKVVKKRTRSDWERLGMATSLSNNAVQWSLGIAMATKSPGVHLRSIPGFQRRLENATDFAATRLHAILYNGKEAQKDLREEILNWRGVSGDALPSLYLRLVRWFEATGSTRWSKTQLVRFLFFSFCFSLTHTHTHNSNRYDS